MRWKISMRYAGYRESTKQIQANHSWFSSAWYSSVPWQYVSLLRECLLTKQQWQVMAVVYVPIIVRSVLLLWWKLNDSWSVDEMEVNTTWIRKPTSYNHLHKGWELAPIYIVGDLRNKLVMKIIFFTKMISSMWWSSFTSAVGKGWLGEVTILKYNHTG
jgi:hypothetical protein